MNKLWPSLTLVLSLALLGSLKSYEIAQLKPFFRATKVFIPQTFKDAGKGLEGPKKEAFGIWESLLFGKSKHVKKETIETFRTLGLLHLFTPSGFHLSAALLPLFYFLRTKKKKVIALLGIGAAFFFIPGLGALKRMLLIKIQQKFWGQKAGFVLGCLIDLLFGSFQSAPLSFTYSFLFLSFIYGGYRGIGLIVWFYLGQVIISYFQGGTLSPLLLLTSPMINFAFSLLLPLLILLSFPLHSFQIKIGIFFIEITQKIVGFGSNLASFFPSFEITGLMLLFLTLFMLKRFRSSLILFLIISQNLNSDFQKTPNWNQNEFVPQRKIITQKYLENKVMVYFEDGTCDLKLVKGFWWENCSPKRGSSRKF